MLDDNPLLHPSPLPHGLPPYDRIRFAHFAPAFDRGLAEHLAEVAAITADPAAPTFDNTVVPLERSGRLLDRVQRVFSSRASTDIDDDVAALEAELAPRLAAHADAILLDGALYERISAVHAARAELDEEARYLVERLHTRFTLAGAGLDDEDKAALSVVNADLATLTTRFKANLQADTNDLAVHVTDPAELDGLTPGEISAAAGAAAARGLDGWLLTLILPTGQPVLSSLTHRGLRERLMAAARARGRRGNAHDNRDLVLALVRTRARRARLLGFATHADWVTANQTAGTPGAVADLLGRLAPVAARNARAEAALLQARADALQDAAGQPRFPLASWDWAFYAELVRAAEHDVDVAAMRPYLEAERVLQDGVFHAAEAVFGVTFTERHDLPTYHPDVRTFEVHDADGSPVGLFLLDLYTRDAKRGGAWMNSLAIQSDLLGQPTPVVVNNLNVPQPAPGEPTLLTLDEVRTLFHEFGHALHGLFARVTYPSASGTAVHRDFVEFPSQVNEMWILWPEVVSRYAVHHATGEPMPPEWIQRLRDSATFGEGHATSEYLAAALLDQAWHSLTVEQAEAVTDVDAFEADALAAAGLDDPLVPPRYGSTYFAHVFAGSGGYDAGYYGYIWSEVLDADAVRWFEEHGGLTRENGDRFRRHVLAVGGSRDPLQAYREFRGRDAVIEPLLERRGLVA